MRRSSYQDRMERHQFNKGATKSQVQDINLQNFKVSAGRVPDNNFVSSRQQPTHYNSKAIKQMISRPYTTQKTSSYLDYRSSDFSM